MALTLRKLRYFQAAAEAGQISAAAKSVNISQSAMTLAIRDLEADLNVKLFDRTPGGIELTREGRAFLVHAEDIQDRVNLAKLSVRDEKDPIAGELKVGVTYTLSSYFLFPKLARLAREHPALQVHAVEADRRSIEAMLIAGEIDFGLLLTSNVEQADELMLKTFHRSPRQLWTAIGHPLQDRIPVKIDKLADYPFVLLKADEAENHADMIWRRFRVRLNVVFVSGSIEAVRNMVANGLAITVLSDVVYRPWTVDGLRVAKRSLVEPLPTMDVGIAWRKSQKQNPASAAFIDLFS
jgi:DNA-binding transcriptional LysR family regulator